MAADQSNTQRFAGVDRQHAPSWGPKITFWLCHGVLLGSAIYWLVKGISLFDFTVDLPRAWLLTACIALYWLRHGVTLFSLLKRKIEWSESLGLLCFMMFFEWGLLLVGGGWSQYPLFSWPDCLAIVLVLLGSVVNTGSEWQRMVWKKDPANKGKLYTRGLFKYAMHINYFGDVLLFSGWALLTTQPWTLLLPLCMALSFIYFHIPGLDQYLATRYGQAFQDYTKRTKKLIPGIY